MADTVAATYKPPVCRQFKGPKLDAVQVLPKKKSILDECGHRLLLPGGRLNESNSEYILDNKLEDVFYFHCAKCVDKVTLIKLPKGATGDGTKHCKIVHNVQSSYTLSKLAKDASRAQEAQENSDFFKNDPVRFCKLLLAGLTVEKCVPFNFFEGNCLTRFMGTHPQGRKLVNFNPRKTITELFVHFKKTVMATHQRLVMKYGGVPFLNVNIDLYTSPVQGRKYVALRLNWFDATAGGPMSVTLAVREYRVDRTTKDAASKVLYDWMVEHCKCYGIVYEEHVLCSTADFGSDVRRCLCSLAGSINEWCISHMLNCAFVEGFGGSADPQKSKYIASRKVFDAVRGVIESINKSPVKKDLFLKLQKKRFGIELRLKNHPIHRWGSAEAVLKRVLQSWPSLVEMYEELDNDFPLEDQYDKVAELYSIMAPLREVQTLAQRTKSVSVFETYLMLHHRYLTTCNPVKPLSVLHPPRM